MKVPLSGASSFLGLAPAKELLDVGHEVFTPLQDRPGRTGLPLTGASFHLFSGDMEDRAALRQNLERELTATGALPSDVCFHLVWGGVGQCGRVDREIQDRNLAASEGMVALAAGFGVRRFLFADSQAEYDIALERVQCGEMPGTVIDERAPCCPISEYGRAKLAFSARGGEMATRLDADYRHLHVFLVYGLGDHETSLVASAVRAARAGETATFNLCAQQWSFLALTNAVRALRLLGEVGVLRADGNPVLNVGSLNTRELRRFVEEIFEVTGEPASLAHFAPWETGPEGAPYLTPDIARLLRNIDWMPEISFRTGVRELLSDTVNGENWGKKQT